MYYNQNDYPKTPYPAPGYQSATVKSGGCGPTTMAMVVEDLTGTSCPPPKMAEYAIKCGARVSGGTDMAKLCNAVAKDFGLKYSATNQAADALAALNRGAAVIANVGGDRTGHKGLFSTGGHYIYLWDNNGTRVTVWDPGDYTSPNDKYKINGRASRVTLNRPDIYAEMVEIDKDCANRSPRYYILEDEDMTQEQFDKMMDDYIKRRAALPVNQSIALPEFQAAIIAGITDGTKPQAFVTRQEAAIMAKRAKEAK